MSETVEPLLDRPVHQMGGMWGLSIPPYTPASTPWITTMFELQCIDHIALLVRNVEDSVRWYQEVLRLDRLHQEAWGSFPAVVGKGGTSLALFPVSSSHPKPPPGRDTICMRHIAFRTDAANFQEARAALNRRGIAFRSEDHQIAHSIYFEDPDGHQLEITTYDIRSTAAPQSRAAPVPPEGRGSR